MRSQSGLTMIELVVALGLLTLLAGFAVSAGGTMVRKAQEGRAATTLVDAIALARMNAIAKDRPWRISFTRATPASTVAQEMLLESCANPPTCSVWVPESEPRLIRDRLALHVPTSGGAFIELQFTGSGYFIGPAQEIGVCGLLELANKDKHCQSGTLNRVVRIHAHTGLVDY